MRSISSLLKRPSLYLTPLILALTVTTPSFPVAHYGVTYLEVLVVFYSSLFIPHSLVLPKWLLCFLFLFSAGVLGAHANLVVAYNGDIGLYSLNHIYILLLAVLSFNLGLKNRLTLDEILNHPFFLYPIYGLLLLILIYPFMSLNLRELILGPFYSNVDNFQQYLTNARFPGLGVNNVIYTFMLTTIYILSLNQAMTGTLPVLFPFVLLLAIIVCASKLNLFLCVISTFIICISTISFSLPAFRFEQRRKLFNYILLLLICLGLPLVYFWDFFYHTLETFSRLEVLSDNSSAVGFGLRFKNMSLGLERIALAPFLGIARDPFMRTTGLVGFTHPHNEWLRLWMISGILGLISWIFLFLIQLSINIASRFRVFILYTLCFAIFMFFDGGVLDPRFIVFYFFVFGLNVSLIKQSFALSQRHEY